MYNFSSGYGSLPGSTRNSVIETNLPPVPGHACVYGSDSDLVHKSSPDTSPLAAKKWSVSGYRQSREEPNAWVCPQYLYIIEIYCYACFSSYIGIHDTKWVWRQCIAYQLAPRNRIIHLRQCTLREFLLVTYLRSITSHLSYSQLAHRPSRTDSASPQTASRSTQ